MSKDSTDPKVQFKQQASRLRAFLAQLGLELNHTRALEAWRRARFNRSWSEAAAMAHPEPGATTGPTGTNQVVVARELLERFLNSGSTEGCEDCEVFDAAPAEELRAIVFGR